MQAELKSPPPLIPPAKSQYIGFWDYFSACFLPFQGISLPLKPMHQEVCETLQKVVLGQLPQYRFVIINIAPRVGKTLIAIALATWMMAYFPDSQIINTSLSAPLAEKSTRLIKSVMESAWYRTLFPWVALGGVQKANEFDTNHKGKVYGAGVGGTIIGYGAGLKRPAGGFINIDDPSNPNEVLSHTEAEKLHFWFENTIIRRRNSSSYTPIILIAQRLCDYDLPGYVMDKYREQTLVIKFQVLVDGVSQFPETITTEDILKTKEVNPFVFWAQLQQEPIIQGGNLLKTDDFLLYDADSTSMKWDKKIIVADTALEVKEANDNSVLQCWGKLGNKAYLIDQAWGKWESPDLLANYKAFYHKHNLPGNHITRCTVENKASGIGLRQQLNREGIPVEGIDRTKDKTTRVQEILPYVVTHMVYLPRRATFLPSFLAECARFRADGKHEHDDQVDTLCDGVWQTLGKPLSILDVLGKTAAR